MHFIAKTAAFVAAVQTTMAAQSAVVQWTENGDLQRRLYTIQNGRLNERSFSGRGNWSDNGAGNIIGVGVDPNSGLSAVAWFLGSPQTPQIRVYYTTTNGDIAERAYGEGNWYDGPLPRQKP